MSLESHVVRTLEDYESAMHQACKNNNPQEASDVIKAMKEHGFEAYAHVLTKKYIKLLKVNNAPHTGNDWPTQEEINNGFKGINSGNYE